MRLFAPDSPATIDGSPRGDPGQPDFSQPHPLMRELAPIYSAATPARLRSTLVAFLVLMLALGIVATIASA